jgi:hypothetical protein
MVCRVILVLSAREKNVFRRCPGKYNFFKNVRVKKTPQSLQTQQPADRHLPVCQPSLTSRHLQHLRRRLRHLPHLPRLWRL